MFNKIEGVLMQLNKHEREGLEHILFTAEEHLDEVPRSAVYETIGMIDELRKVFDIEPLDAEDQPEGRLLAIARHKTGRTIDCASDNCVAQVTATSGRTWKVAREQGWKLAYPEQKDVVLLFCPSCSEKRGLER